jgi:hypothetical protein
MKKLFIEQTAYSPKVNFDPENNFFEISGESRPPDVDGFYSEIIKWFDDYSSSIIKMKGVKKPAFFNLNFNYFNSPSAKYILNFCKHIGKVRSKGENIGIKWYYEKDDTDMLEMGKEISRIAQVPFEYSLKDVD